MDLWRLSSCTPSGQRGETVTMNASPPLCFVLCDHIFQCARGLIRSRDHCSQCVQSTDLRSISSTAAVQKHFTKASFPPGTHGRRAVNPNIVTYPTVLSTRISTRPHAATSLHWRVAVSLLNTSASDTGRLQRGQPTSMAYKYRASS